MTLKSEDKAGRREADDGTHVRLPAVWEGAGLFAVGMSFRSLVVVKFPVVSHWYHLICSCSTVCDEAQGLLEGRFVTILVLAGPIWFFVFVCLCNLLSYLWTL